jgi:cytidylate kinase
MGSGGTYIGYQVAKTLGFSYVDREILRRAASLLKRDTVSLEECEETSSGLIRNLLRELAFAPETAAYMPGERPVYDGDLFVLEGEIIKAMVDRHNAVIMGHGGFYLLKDRPGTVHLFIYAPRDYRVERVMKAHGTANVREAQDMVDESDRRRSKLIRDIVGREWADARNYHLCIDSGILGLSESVRMVIRFLETTLP